jgi:uncharacterized protein (DUF2236 family)
MINSQDPFLENIATIPHQGIAGYFGPQSISWRLYREPIVIFGGMRALLLQVAHPAVAEGVAKFSRFREDALGRGIRTFEAMATIYFGSDEEARATATRLHRMHAGIRSHYPAEVTGGNAGQAFHANQPELLLWVLATLTDTTLTVFEHFTPKNLPTDWREQFYEESKIAAQLLGIQPEFYPQNLVAFRAYMASMLGENTSLGSANVSAEITEAILKHKYNVTWMAHLMAIGWMPPFISTRLGMKAEEKEQKKFLRLLKFSKFIYACVPGFFKKNPALYQANYRIHKAKGEKTSLTERFFWYLGTKAYFPFGLRTK